MIQLQDAHHFRERQRARRERRHRERHRSRVLARIFVGACRQAQNQAPENHGRRIQARYRDNATPQQARQFPHREVLPVLDRPHRKVQEAQIISI